MCNIYSDTVVQWFYLSVLYILGIQVLFWYIIYIPWFVLKAYLIFWLYKYVSSCLASQFHSLCSNLKVPISTSVYFQKTNTICVSVVYRTGCLFHWNWCRLMALLHILSGELWLSIFKLNHIWKCITFQSLLNYLANFL